MSKVFIDTTLVDGFADGPHITEKQVGIANQGLYGPDDYVLDEGKKSEAQILTNNSIRIFDATYVIQGRRDVIAANDYTDVNIDNGAQGMNRNDIIVRRYRKDESSEIEETEYAVIKGTPISGTASDPEVATGVIRNGDTLHEMKLYRVKLNGLNIVAVEPLFNVLMSMSKLTECLKDYIIEQGKQLIPNTNRYNYYEKYASGKLVQWGIANCSYTDGYGIIKYAIPFAGSTKDYVLFAQGQYISGKVVEVMVASKHSTSQGYAYSRGLNGANIDTHDFDWYAVGRWK
nr:MAG TPA: hypothetical protein [Bacteriophage sp.]